MTDSKPPKETEQRARRTIVVGRHGSPRRVPLEQLELVVARLREATAHVAEDLGVTGDDVGQVELVDLIHGSGGLVFEQAASTSIDNNIIPLIATIDAARAIALGRPIDPLLTTRSQFAVQHMVDTFGQFASAPAPIFLADTETIHATDESLPPITQIKSYIPLPDRTTIAEASDGPARIKKLEEQSETDLPSHEEWLLTFTGKLRRLDDTDTMIWVDTSRGRAKGKVSRALFEEADADETRWHQVSVVCLSSSPNVKDVKEYLHIAPAEKGSPDYVATPMNDAAKGIEKVLARLDEFGALQANWNSHGSKPIGLSARKTARGFLLLASTTIRSSGNRFREPFATPLPNGNVQLEWEQDERYLELEFSNQGAIDFLRMYGNKSAEGKATRETAIDMVVWFHRGGAR